MKYIEVLKDLIFVDTSVPPGLNYDRAVDYLEPLFKALGRNPQGHNPCAVWCGRIGMEELTLIVHQRGKGKPRRFL